MSLGCPVKSVGLLYETAQGVKQTLQRCAPVGSLELGSWEEEIWSASGDLGGWG